MSDNTKKIALIVIIVLAIVGAGFGASRLFGGEQMQVEVVRPAGAGHKSEKQQALDAQQKAGGEAKGEVDLGGPISGGG